MSKSNDETYKGSKDKKVEKYQEKRGYKTIYNNKKIKSDEVSKRKL